VKNIRDKIKFSSIGSEKKNYTLEIIFILIPSVVNDTLTYFNDFNVVFDFGPKIQKKYKKIIINYDKLYLRRTCVGKFMEKILKKRLVFTVLEKFIK